jgi:hypothetical protein
VPPPEYVWQVSEKSEQSERQNESEHIVDTFAVAVARRRELCKQVRDCFTSRLGVRSEIMTLNILDLGVTINVARCFLFLKVDGRKSTWST